MNKKYFSGVILSLIGCSSLGILGIVDKIGTIQSNNPLIFSTQSLLISLLFTTIFALIYFKGKLIHNIKSLPLPSLGLIVLVGTFASGFTILLRFLGLMESTGTFATLSQVITTSLTALLALIFLKEKLLKAFWGFFAIIILATYFVSVGKIAVASIKTGDMFIILSTFFLATGNIFSGIAVRQASPILVSVGRFLVGFIFLLMVSFIIVGGKIFNFSNYWVLVSGLFWSISIITFNLALQKIGVTLVTSLLMIAPVITMVLEYLLLGYNFTLVQVIAALVVVISGIGIILTRQ